MKRISLLVVLILIGSVVTTQILGKGKTTLPPDKYEKIMFLVGKMLSDGHYSPQQIDNAFSKRVFDRYLTELDPEKNIFLKSDIEALRVYETKIDDELTGAPILFFKAVGNIFTNRVVESELLCQKVLSNSFAFTSAEGVVLNADKLDFPLNETEKEQRWKNKLKHMSLERYAEGLELNKKTSEKDGKGGKSEVELEKDARDKVGKIMARTFDRFRNKFNEDDKFNLFVNTITTTMDPHTEFMPPVDKRYFDEEMAGQFYGIGATLQYDEGNIKITSVVAGSPAYKSGQIQAGDIILKVGQGEEEPVDLSGFITTDAVKLIRGKKDSEVRLTIRKIDGTTKVVSLIRDRIVQDEGYARSAIIQDNGQKIGYIYLPDFYADFENANGRRCFTDVAIELEKLKAEGISGLVFDLRNNGGGSLYDVVQMAGLFIEEGPIVQVKDRDRPATILKDKDRAMQYNGPLVVLVNELSASASEIFAAAMQDYGRGIIMGSSSTFGKGTVQRNIGLDPQFGFSYTNAELGTVKLTLQKFYRVNGGSTQLMGVIPDVIIPDNMEYLKFREKDTKESLSWDQISKTSFITWTPSYQKDSVVAYARRRISNDKLFQLINSTSLFLSKQNEHTVNLQLEAYKKTQEQIRSAVKQLDSLQQSKNSMQVHALQGEENRWSNDKPKQERFERWLKSLGKDIYIEQGVKTMKDMIRELPTTAKRA
ncbi:MAG: PDZ domain-containing protein [Bacteroidetes bacterium]|nr:PDZ domain-containing protein [Bacteroidota bacterium]